MQHSVTAQIQLPPGAVPITNPKSVPSQAQIQSDEAKHSPPQSLQYALAMANQVNARLGNDTSAAHMAQILKQMTVEGKINCPTPISNPGHCFFTPPGQLMRTPITP